MTRRTSIVLGLLAAGVFAAGAALAVTNYSVTWPGATSTPAQPPPAPQWSATSPGRVEPRGGETRLSSLAPGRVSELAVAVNDRVRAGDLLIALDDEDVRARVAAADAEVAVRRRDRDAETVARPALDRRQSEDAVAAAERTLILQRLELDRLLRQRRTGTGVTDDALTAQRAVIGTAADRVEQERATHRRNQTAVGMPQPTRLEAAVTAARAEVRLAETAWERTRLRAPVDGTVLQTLVRVGELASASPEQTVIVMGDLSMLRARAEVEERDLAKVNVGQAVVVRTDAYPGRDFTGTVVSLAQALSPAKIAQRGPRRPNDHDTLEVQVDLEQGSPLLPGMRVDVFFRADAPPKAAAAAAPAR